MRKLSGLTAAQVKREYGFTEERIAQILITRATGERAKQLAREWCWRPEHRFKTLRTQVCTRQSWPARQPRTPVRLPACRRPALPGL